jgi:hypothetical protein
LVQTKNIEVLKKEINENSKRAKKEKENKTGDNLECSLNLFFIK